MNPRHRVVSFSLCSASIFILQLAMGLVLVSVFAQSAQGAELRLEKTQFAPENRFVSRLRHRPTSPRMPGSGLFLRRSRMVASR